MVEMRLAAPRASAIRSRIKWSLKRGLIAADPSRGYELPLTPRAVEIVKKALETSPGPWLFWALGTLGEQGGKWRSQRLGAKLHARLKACGIDHGTLHVFRHSFCSFLANNPSVPLPQL
jgi:integrase